MAHFTEAVLVGTLFLVCFSFPTSSMGSQLQKDSKSSSTACNIPPRFWCDNKEIAISCGVLKQCQMQEWVNSTAKVDLTLYYESLCPDCQDFISNMLYPTWTLLGSIMNLTLVPYGNAEEVKQGDKWKFNCQHGPKECVGNLIEVCAIHVTQNMSAYFPFINCMEKSNKDPESAAKECADSSFPLEKVLHCSKSDLGNKLEHDMAVKTDALQPTHTYVPWVTLNGVHTEAINTEALNNLPKLLCDTYKGPKPPACKDYEW